MRVCECVCVCVGVCGCVWGGASITIIIFTSLKKVALQATSVKREKTEKDRRRGGKRPLMTVIESKAQLHFSAFIAVLVEHTEHPHNN